VTEISTAAPVLGFAEKGMCERERECVRACCTCLSLTHTHGARHCMDSRDM